MKKAHIILTLGFVAFYSLFVFFINIEIELSIASELLVASVFFFALFSGFFIARQNDRYTRIIDIIAERDGLYSCLYRVFGIVPRVQDEMRKSIKTHYTKIIDSNDWAYNELHPSTTITELTKSMSSITEEEAKKIEVVNPFDGIWDVIVQLQQNRKKIIAAHRERLLIFQWILIYIFAGLTLFAFNFIQTDYFLVNLLKIIFGTAVFLVVILIKQLNELSIFGKNFSQKIAGDVIRIVEERDIEEIEKEKNKSS